MQAHLVLRPWAGAREQGRMGVARLLLIMQFSLVLWPAAIRLARRVELEGKKQRLLDILAEANATPLPQRLALLNETREGQILPG